MYTFFRPIFLTPVTCDRGSALNKCLSRTPDANPISAPIAGRSFQFSSWSIWLKSHMSTSHFVVLLDIAPPLRVYRYIYSNIIYVVTISLYIRCKLRMQKRTGLFDVVFSFLPKFSVFFRWVSKTPPEDYEGEREFDDLAKFVKENLGPRCPVPWE